MWTGEEYMRVLIQILVCGFTKDAHVHESRSTLQWSCVSIQKCDDLFSSHMMRFVITCVIEPLYLTWRKDDIASIIVGIFMHEHVDFAMVGL